MCLDYLNIFHRVTTKDNFDCCLSATPDFHDRLRGAVGPVAAQKREVYGISICCNCKLHAYICVVVYMCICFFNLAKNIKFTKKKIEVLKVIDCNYSVLIIITVDWPCPPKQKPQLCFYFGGTSTQLVN